jgi:tripartite-type tricarboxylate transporter receptor subunit TctC
VADVMGGHVAMTFVPIAAAVAPVKSGRLRALGITGSLRAPALPDVPTINEAGVAGYHATSWNALFAPGATPRDIVLRIHATLVNSLRAARVKEILVGAGADAAAGTPEDMGAFLRTEMTKWGNVVIAAGIKAE